LGKGAGAAPPPTAAPLPLCRGALGAILVRIYVNGMAAGGARNPNLVRRSSQARGFWCKRAAEGRREANDRDLFPQTVPCLKGRRQAPAVQFRTSPMMCWQLFLSSCATSMHGVSNHRGCCKRSGDQSQRDVMLRHADKWRLGPSPERTSPEEPDAS
jgi:hypothetical protein